ncbi:SDR family NAD(P)-dependent oxidoreductase [Enterovirga sp. CN4-39]|uniref:SDR family NAD(P)-dependent oxidoreductase n=1 Tax=Enterovirga sp. CN4-39 TaxID=3400910 RepID=UPI003C05878F
MTGSSRGIGAAIARRLAVEGSSVVVNYAGGAAEAADVVAAIIAAGRSAIPVRADISKPDDFAQLFDVAEETFGSVDVLVNNARIVKLSLIGKRTTRCSIARSPSTSRAFSMAWARGATAARRRRDRQLLVERRRAPEPDPRCLHGDAAILPKLLMDRDASEPIPALLKHYDDIGFPTRVRWWNTRCGCPPSSIGTQRSGSTAAAYAPRPGEVGESRGRIVARVLRLSGAPVSRRVRLVKSPKHDREGVRLSVSAHEGDLGQRDVGRAEQRFRQLHPAVLEMAVGRHADGRAEESAEVERAHVRDPCQLGDRHRRGKVYADVLDCPGDSGIADMPDVPVVLRGIERTAICVDEVRREPASALLSIEVAGTPSGRLQYRDYGARDGAFA